MPLNQISFAKLPEYFCRLGSGVYFSKPILLQVTALMSNGIFSGEGI